MSGWRLWFNGQRGTLLALAIFVLMFALYLANHPAIVNNGYTVQGVGNVVQTAANKGILLALIAIAQTFAVLTAGIDLSVGAIFVLCNVVASFVVVDNLGAAWGFDLGPVAGPALGVIIVLVVGIACGAVNGAIVIFGRLQPIVATIATSAAFFGLALWMRPQPGSTPEFAKALGKAMLNSMIVAGVIACLDAPPADDGAEKAGGSTKPHALYNIGNHKSEYLMKVIGLLENACGRKAELEMLPMQPGDVHKTYADIEAIRRDRGYAPTTDIEAGVPRFVEWFRAYHGI